jgi:threonine/homoserine/homoserine lactone efflux protein
MTDLLPFLAILGVLAVGTVSPGPSFVFVARTSIAQSRGDGLAAAVGMGIGGVTFAILALLGLRAVLVEQGWLYAALRLCGGAYLLYLAAGLWRGATRPLASPLAMPARGRGLGRSFAAGLLTQLSNPKTAVVYGSVFAALLPARPAAWMFIALPSTILIVEAGWYAVVALSFSAERPRALYAAGKRWIDRAAGAIMAALGARLLIEALRPG